MIKAMRVPSHVTSAVDGDGAIVLDSRQGKFFSMNGVAALIWQEIQAGTPQLSIEERCMEQYELTPEMARSDVQAFVQRLAEIGLVEAEY